VFLVAFPGGAHAAATSRQRPPLAAE